MRRERIRGISPELQASAQLLRREMTPAEKKLWEAIRDRQLDGVRFRRQHPLGQVVLDFCAPSLRLVIEVDGPIHSRQREQDQSRTECLEAHDYRVMRICNDEILRDLPRALNRIREEIKERRGKSPR